jgi:hypothetical protein
MFASERLMTAVEERLLGKACVEQYLGAARQLHLLFGDRALARLADRHAECARGLVEKPVAEAGLLGQLLARIELSLAGENALDR